jgi:hypothetical protein
MELDPLIVKLLLDSSGYSTNLKTAESTTTSTGASLKSTLSGVGLGGVAAFIGITGAIAGTVEILKECYATTMDYIHTVERMSLLNGSTIEDTARLIAVTGRYEVSQQQLDLASRTLAKEGLSLTTATIAKLSDEYLKLTTADEKEAFLMANFGARGGTAFVELMNAGGKAITAEATAVSDGLIPNQAMLDMQNAQKNAVYDLGLAWKVFELQIGTEIIPGLTELVKAITPLVSGLKWIIDAIQWIGAHQIGNIIGNWAAGNLTDAFQLLPGYIKTPTVNSGHAQGTQGWQTVPSGFPDDSYKVGLTSGETYAVNKTGSNNATIDYRKLARAIRDALNG